MSKQITPAVLLVMIAKELELTADELASAGGPDRKSVRVTEFRYIMFYLLEKAGYTQTQIADFFGLTRTRVNIALTTLKGWVRIYASMKEKVDRCERRMNQ